MKIAQVRITPVAFKDPPLLNSAGIHEPYALRSIIEIESGCGRLGLGESYGDSPILVHLATIAPKLIGMSVYDLNRLAAVVASVCGSATAAPAATITDELALAPGTHMNKAAAKAFAAFEVALLDLQAQAANVSLATYLGGAVRDHVDYSAYLFFKYAQHIDSPYPADPWGEATDAAGIVAQAQRMINLYGFGSIKLKAGALTPDAEADCIVALRQAFPNHPLRIDPNANWSLATSIRIAQRLGPLLEYYEDPTPGLDGMAALHAQTGVPLATNMVVTSFAELRESIPKNAVQIVLSDHHFWGGLRATQQLANLCDMFDIGVSMHSNSHLGISLMAMTHVGATIPNLCHACDTHYPWQEEDVIAGPRIPIVGGKVAVTTAPGLGVTLDNSKLAELHQQYVDCGIRDRSDHKQMLKYQPNFPKGKPRY